MKSQKIGLAEHMLRGAIKGGLAGAIAWKVSVQVVKHLPETAPVVLPAAGLLWAVGASCGAMLGGGAYVVRFTSGMRRVRA
ncbi:MAG: hypothetical protein JJU29_12745 [Verrucomicrobia bacterium]|nr:hypothetical protein [Verrucomicrobiota bacterium]